MKWIIDFFRLDFDPERDGVSLSNAKEIPARQSSASIPDNIHFIESQRAAFVQDGEEWTIWQADKRTAELSNNDREMLDNIQWTKEVKYRTIKSKWALNLSISEASKSLTSEYGRGYGNKTVEKYYSLINKAAGTSRPPIAQEWEGFRKTPQKHATILQSIKY